MDVEEFKQKYEKLKDNPMYKNFCSILDTKNQVLERIVKENQELKKQLSNSHQIKTKQKEFIEYLNKYIKERRRLSKLHKEYSLSEERLSAQCHVLENVLLKYKEIIGGSNGK